MAKPEKEKCPKCGSTIFAITKDKSNKHYCQAKSCGNVWVPGNEGMKRADVVLKQAQTENQGLKEELGKARARIADLEKQLAASKPLAENEIFT